MRFNPKARLDTSRVHGSRGEGARGGGGSRIPLPGGARAGGGVGILVIVVVVLLLKVFGGIDLTGAVSGTGMGNGPGGFSASRFTGDDTAYHGCRSGQDANDHPTTCGVVAVENSLVDYWRRTLPQQASNAQFHTERAIRTFNGQVPTGCGQASAATGPFYCPSDQTIYFDPSFFREILQGRLHGPSGAFVEPYVIAHEFGHHIQNLLGTMSKVRTQQGPDSDSVRLELQADCYAGMWARNATTTEDSQGNVLIQDLTARDIQDAIDAAKSVGDDTIQRETSGRVNPEQWTHGSSAARVHWFTVGFQNGTLSACNTFHGQNVE